jgi:hypothetical protein
MRCKDPPPQPSALLVAISEGFGWSELRAPGADEWEAETYTEVWSWSWKLHLYCEVSGSQGGQYEV